MAHTRVRLPEKEREAKKAKKGKRKGKKG